MLPRTYPVSLSPKLNLDVIKKNHILDRSLCIFPKTGINLETQGKQNIFPSTQIVDISVNHVSRTKFQSISNNSYIQIDNASQTEMSTEEVVGASDQSSASRKDLTSTMLLLILVTVFPLLQIRHKCSTELQADTLKHIAKVHTLHYRDVYTPIFSYLNIRRGKENLAIEKET